MMNLSINYRISCHSYWIDDFTLPISLMKKVTEQNFTSFHHQIQQPNYFSTYMVYIFSYSDKLSLPLGKANALLLFQIPCLLGYSRCFLEILSSFLGYQFPSPSLFFFLSLQTYCYFSSVKKKRAYSLYHTACSSYQAINSKMLQTTFPQLCCLQFLSSHFSLKTILIRILTPSFQKHCCCQGYW